MHRQIKAATRENLSLGIVRKQAFKSWLTKQWLLLDFNFSTSNTLESKVHAILHFYNIPNMTHGTKIFVSTIQSHELLSSELNINASALCR